MANKFFVRNSLAADHTNVAGVIVVKWIIKERKYMTNRIFPAEIIDNSQESNFSRHSVTSRIIYAAIILSLAGMLALLPFIEMDIGVRSQGLIRPVTGVVYLSAPVSGQIQSFYASENSKISRGDIFAVIEAPQLEERVRFNLSRQEQVSRFLLDLKTLQEADSYGIRGSLPLYSPRYIQAFAEFRQHLINENREVERLNRNLERERILYNHDAISLAEVDETLYLYEAARNHIQLLVEQQQNRWKLDEITYQKEQDELQSEYQQLQQEISHYQIRSPISGTVQNVSGIYRHSFIQANEVLGEISPDTSLVAETYVSPQDIGLIRAGMPVRIQIDAYNYNQWGVMSGKVVDVARDIMMWDNQPVFRVRCSLDKDYLELPNGVKGDIKKGMTFQARFIVARRSLFQLLFDKMDDWLNPLWSENEYLTQN